MQAGRLRHNGPHGMHGLLLILTLLGLAADARHRGGVWDFQKDAPGKPPTGFFFQVTERTGREPAGKWRVVEEGENKLLAQLDRSRDDLRFALAIVEGTSLEHLRLSCRVKAVDGTDDQSGGLVWRYRNSENYLVARLDVREDNVRLYRVVNGNRVKFGGEGDLGLKAGRWYALRVEHRGETVKVYLDGEMLFDERDRHFRGPGKFGLWTEADSVTHFDDLRAEPLDHRRRRDDDDDD